MLVGWSVERKVVDLVHGKDYFVVASKELQSTEKMDAVLVRLMVVHLVLNLVAMLANWTVVL